MAISLCQVQVVKKFDDKPDIKKRQVNKLYVQMNEGNFPLQPLSSIEYFLSVCLSAVLHKKKNPDLISQGRANYTQVWMHIKVQI